MTAIPDELYEHAETLEFLDLSYNNLTALPDEFSCLKKLRVLFCSGNSFSHLPTVLGECPELSQIGFRGSGIVDVPATALPTKLRWLTLTGNKISKLPIEIGQCARLKKLMLSGNELSEIPESLLDAQSLELIRLAANDLLAIPTWLAELPNLAWIAVAANTKDAAWNSTPTAVSWSSLDVGSKLGEGASGWVFDAVQNSTGQQFAVKVFKDSITSDGHPGSEVAAAIAAGYHPNLTGAMARLVDHPGGRDGLVMKRLPTHWKTLAQPPSLDSCTRDIFDPSLILTAETAARIAAAVSAGVSHLASCGIIHGDLYAHNVIWDGVRGSAILSDFGAASLLPPHEAESLQTTDVLALGILIKELIDQCCDEVPEALTEIANSCTNPRINQRLSMAEAAFLLNKI